MPLSTTSTLASSAIVRRSGGFDVKRAAASVDRTTSDSRDESEFVTISYWESVEAMSRFAGPDPRRIHHLERDAEFLIELPGGVQVLEIVAASGRTGGAT